MGTLGLPFLHHRESLWSSGESKCQIKEEAHPVEGQGRTASSPVGANQGRHPGGGGINEWEGF